MSKKMMIKYLKSLNVFQKKAVLIELVKANTDLNEIELVQQIEKINKFTAEETEKVLDEVIDTYV